MLQLPVLMFWLPTLWAKAWTTEDRALTNNRIRPPEDSSHKILSKQLWSILVYFYNMREREPTAIGSQPI